MWFSNKLQLQQKNIGKIICLRAYVKATTKSQNIV
jgi:hypothetical protein